MTDDCCEEEEAHEDALGGAKDYAPNCARCWQPAPDGAWCDDGWVHEDCEE